MSICSVFAYGTSERAGEQVQDGEGQPAGSGRRCHRHVGRRRLNALVLVALRRPLTFVVMAILILLFGTSAVLKTPTDIFPPIRIPVVAAVWTYTGLLPTDMSGRIVYYYERTLTTTVSNIKSIDSQSYYGSGIVKIYFQPGTDIAAAEAQVTASSQTILKTLPAGSTPPEILVFDASSVPVIGLQVAADDLTPDEIYDLASNIIRPALIGPIDYMVVTNATPLKIDAFNDLPVKQVGNAVVYLRDVAFVHRGGPPQRNTVVVAGHQSVLLEVLKSGDASTLSVVAGIKAKLPGLERTLPKGVKLTVIGAVLAGLAVLLFVGSWRSTLIVATSIPLSILCSIIALSWVGQDINVMTLGGLALAVGILVDDATVMIENINTHLEEAVHGSGEVDLTGAIVTAANQIVVPTFVSTLCICIVWLPLFQLGGVAGFLFLPLAEAVVFAMIASFVLSRTLTPTMANWLLRGQVAAQRALLSGERRPGPFTRFQRGFEARFERFRDAYRGALERLSGRRRAFSAAYLLAAVASLGLLAVVGQDFFPEIRSGEIDMHVRFPAGTRIEDSSKGAVLVGNQIEALLPGQVTGTLANCGLPFSGINQAYSDSGTVGTQDCDVTISLRNGESPVAAYRQTLRQGLTERFPGTAFSFLPGDITAKILNFGLPSPIDVRISGRDLDGEYAYATRLAARMKAIPGAADVRVQQIMGQPTLLLTSRRSEALSTGLTEADVADNVLATLSGSGQTAPTYWLDPKNGVSHLVNIQTPQSQLTSVNALQTIPVDKGDGNPTDAPVEIVGGLSDIGQTGTPGVVSHHDILPVIDVYANVEGRDLGSVSRGVQAAIDATASEVPRSATVSLGGQSATMDSAYTELLLGLGLSIVLIYLVIVVNFQSWLDPFIVVSALPAALAGCTWALFLTGTTLSVPALTGAIMCMGTATANTILVVDYARTRLAEHGDAALAAVEAGHARIRPVLMTALAMIVGMVPMSVSNTQNAPLGRVVIGGLIVATVTTLVLVPQVFAILHRSRPRAEVLPEATP